MSHPALQLPPGEERPLPHGIPSVTGRSLRTDGLVTLLAAEWIAMFIFFNLAKLCC